MSQPTFIQKIDGSNVNASSLALTIGATAGDMVLVGVILNTNGAQSPQSVATITDSAGSVSGVPVNNWVTPGSNATAIRMEWWVCKLASSITALTIHLTGLQSIIAVALEYSTANGITTPIFQALQASQNTIAGNYIRETASTYPNSGAELMIGLFAMLSDTFNASASAPPATPAIAITEVIRSTGSFSIPPALSYQVIEQGTVDNTGLLSVNALSATELASTANLATSSMQCFYLVISGGLVQNTQPGFSDLPDSTLAAGNYATGLQLAKINGNAALGMCRMEFFQGVYTNGQNVNLPISPVDGYQYQRNELLYIWGIYSTANTGDGWLTGPTALWYCQWEVDQLTGDVTCIENYRSDGSSGSSNDGHLVVFTVGQRQQATLTVSTPPTWTQQQPSTFVQDLAYSQDVLVALNNNAKFSVVGQECISMGEFYNGQTVPHPVSPADGHTYAYSECYFVYSWRWTTTTTQTGFVQPDWNGGGTGLEWFLAALRASVNASTGVVSCAVGWEGRGGDSGYYEDNTDGLIAVFAFCQRARTGAPASPAKNFAEIPNSLFYPSNVLPAGIGAQLVNNINEAALSPEFFGPTSYAPGTTVPTPTSAVDGYAYSRSELVYLWEWKFMSPSGDPPGGGSHNRCALFSGDINQSTGAVTDIIWRYAPGGPYDEYISTFGTLNVLVIGFRQSQQSLFSTPAPGTGGSGNGDAIAEGVIKINGV